MVLDEGEGILPGDLEQIFDKFYRAKRAGQMRAGMGLGLTISRGFIEAMHGTITAANRTDCSGAAFSIRLPISPRDIRDAHVSMMRMHFYNSIEGRISSISDVEHGARWRAEARRVGRH